FTVLAMRATSGVFWHTAPDRARLRRRDASRPVDRGRHAAVHGLAPQDASATGGICQLPFRIDGDFSSGQYMRSIRMKSPAGAGSQLASFSGPGDSCWMYRSTEPSAFFTSSLRWLSVYRFSGLATKKYAASYIVKDQNACTGGSCPFSKCMTYFFDPL